MPPEPQGAPREPPLPAIDFVITWVDGSDLGLTQARREAKAELGKGRSPLRYRDNGEIYYLIASIIKYAPFVRRIYVVTDNQKPPLLDDFAEAGLCSADFIQLVSHDVIFDGLGVKRPTFNARVIEASIWRIPGLAEQFVSCNDDMFLNAPVREEDLFRDGKPVIRGTMTLPEAWHPRDLVRRLFAFGRSDAAADRPTYSLAHERGAKLAGINGRFLLPHHKPHPMRRSTAEAFYAEGSDVLRTQGQHQFRHRSQYMPASLSNHLERRRHGVKFRPRRPIVYLVPRHSPAALERSLTAIRNADGMFGCVQNLERFPPEAQARVHATLREKFSATLPPRLMQAS